MPARFEKNPRKPRSDALRNRERLLDAAKAVFSAGGAEASLEAVARHADVGIGTLYRHFPTREALYEAVYRREVEQLGELAERLKGEASPVEALRRWLHSTVAFVATKKGMMAALAIVYNADSELTAYSSARLTASIGALLVARGRGRRNPRRRQRRRHAARPDRHVHAARSAGLAGERGAAAGCAGGWVEGEGLNAPATLCQLRRSHDVKPGPLCRTQFGAVM